MSNSEETLDQPTRDDLILQAIAELSRKLSDHDKQFEAINGKFEAINGKFEAINGQLEAVRQGIVDNNIRFDRLEGNFHLLRAEVTTLIEEVRHNRKVLV